MKRRKIIRPISQISAELCLEPLNWDVAPAGYYEAYPNDMTGNVEVIIKNPERRDESSLFSDFWHRPGNRSTDLLDLATEHHILPPQVLKTLPTHLRQGAKGFWVGGPSMGNPETRACAADFSAPFFESLTCTFTELALNDERPSAYRAPNGTILHGPFNATCLFQERIHAVSFVQGQGKKKGDCFPVLAEKVATYACHLLDSGLQTRVGAQKAYWSNSQMIGKNPK